MRTYLILPVLLPLMLAGSAGASDVTISIEENPGYIRLEEFPMEFIFDIKAVLSDDLNEGLAGFSFNLSMEFNGSTVDINGVAYAIDLSPGVGMTPFQRNDGLTNPQGFAGTSSGYYLVQIGGWQDTIGNGGVVASFPDGPVVTGIAQPSGTGEVVLATVTITLPTDPDSGQVYTFSVEKAYFKDINDGESAAPYATSSCSVDLSAATIDVPKACPGDLDRNRAVGPGDRGVVNNHLGCPVGTGDVICDACDINGDGMVSLSDIGAIKNMFGPCP